MARSHPLGKPRHNKIGKYLDAQIQKFVTTVSDATTATGLHEDCSICDKFMHKAGKSGKLKTSVFKLLVRLHSDCTKKCLSHLKMKLSMVTVAPVKLKGPYRPQAIVSDIYTDVTEVKAGSSEDLCYNRDKKNAARAAVGMPPLPEAMSVPQPVAKRRRISGTSIPLHSEPEASSTDSPWVKVTSGKRSSKQRRKMKLDLISTLEQECEVLDSKMQLAKRKASDPGLLCSESSRLDVLRDLPGLKKRKRELVDRLKILRPMSSRK